MRNVYFGYGRAASRWVLIAAFATVITVVSGEAGQTAQPAAPPKQPPSGPKPAPAGAKPSPAAKEKVAERADLPSARSIIDRYVKAIGGRAAILAHSSSHATGTITMSGAEITGVLDTYNAKPDKSVQKIDLGGIGVVYEAFDGVHGWSVSPITGPMLTQGKELEEKKFDADFYGDLHEEGRYTSMETVEKTTFEGRPCYKVSLVRKDGGEDIEFYDVETGLRAGATLTRESQMGPVTVTQVYSDYKKFGHLLLPTTMKQSAMGVDQLLKFTSIEFDTVSPSVFEPPAQIKALIK
ncbi:MAG: hypothetical protein ACJ731_07990 [Vicinamibacterales bacterium]